MKKTRQDKEPFWPIAASPRAAFVDVDGTLLLWPGAKAGRVPRLGEEGAGEAPGINQALVNRLRDFKNKGWEIFVWSSGGRIHCERAVEFCGIKDIVSGCLPKPMAVFDDSRRILNQMEERFVLVKGAR